MTIAIRCSTQGGFFQTNYKSNLEVVLPEFDAAKSMKWEFHVDDSQGDHNYNMILVRDILSELKIDLFLSDDIIR